MLTLTDGAASQFRHLLTQEGLPHHGFRVFIQGGGCAGLQYGLAFEDTRREDDTVVEVNGVRLFIDSFSARYLDGASIHYQDAPTGAGFRVDNPNASASCACGSSFRTEGNTKV